MLYYYSHVWNSQSIQFVGRWNICVWARVCGSVRARVCVSNGIGGVRSMFVYLVLFLNPRMNCLRFIELRPGGRWCFSQVFTAHVLFFHHIRTERDPILKHHHPKFRFRFLFWYEKHSFSIYPDPVLDLLLSNYFHFLRDWTRLVSDWNTSANSSIVSKHLLRTFIFAVVCVYGFWFDNNITLSF